LHFVDEKFGNRSIRAWLTVLIDGYSRKVPAWHLSFEKPSYRALMMVIRNCLEHHQRGFDYYVVDQGSEFNGTDFESKRSIAPRRCERDQVIAGARSGSNSSSRLFGQAGNFSSVSLSQA